MKKNIIFLMLSLTCSFFVHGQFRKIAEGATFEEPETGFAKIIQMKNGSTAYVNITISDGIKVMLYDANHAQKVSTVISSGYDELGKFDAVEAVFESANSIIIFISRIEENIPVLTRLIVDGTTGKLKQQKIIGRMKNEWKSPIGNSDAPHYFIVKKDPQSDNYAVALMYNMGSYYIPTTGFSSIREGDEISPIEIIHFGADQNEIGRKQLVFKGADEYRSYLYDIVVVGSEKVIALALFSVKKQPSKMQLFTFEKDKAQVSNVTLPGERYNAFYCMKYNPISEKIVLLVAAAQDLKHIDDYSCFVYLINQVGEVETVKDFHLSEKLQETYKSFFEKKNYYQGMPQDLQINKDGGFTVVYEEITIVYNNSGNGTELGQLVICTYNNKGELVSDYLVPKKHFILKSQLRPFYVHKRSLIAQELFKGNQYKSFVFLSGKTNKYVLFNDTEKNNDINTEKLVAVNGILMKSKLTMVVGVTGDCDAFVYQLAGESVMPKREYFFGEQDKGHALALFTISDYNSETNQYATLKLAKENMKSKIVSLVWLEPK